MKNKCFKNGYGSRAVEDCTETLTNLRFADELLLIAPSKRQIKHMTEDLVVSSREAGLAFHLEKTKVLPNDVDDNSRVLHNEGAMV